MEFLYSFGATAVPAALLAVGCYLLQTRVLDRLSVTFRAAPVKAKAGHAATSLAGTLLSDVPTRSDLNAMRTDLRGEIALLKSAIARWMITAIIINTVALIGGGLLLHGLLRTTGPQ